MRRPRAGVLVAALLAALAAPSAAQESVVTGLSADELRRMRLSTVDVLFDSEHPKTAPVLPTTSLATVGQPGAAMRD